MVQNDEIITNEGTAGLEASVIQSVSEGRYRLIGWGIDTTGRRLIDEICQIAAYTPTAQFSQYIMPYKDINPIFIKHHMLRVVNSGRYRMLKDIRSNKFVKTKSASSALLDFITWLEANRGDASDGIILIYHEFRKASPAILLESLHHYGLLERFSNVVKGFANGFHVAEANCAKTTKSYSLKLMAQVLLNKEEELSSAVDRARVAYEVVVHLGQSERPDLQAKGSGDCTGVESHLVEFVRPFANKVDAEEEEIASLKVLLERQNSFRPVFGPLLRSNRNERQHASHLRRLLAENNIDYNKLKTAYEKEAKDGLDKMLKDEIPNGKTTELSELLEILDCFFDPEKKPIQPKARNYLNMPRRPRFNNKRKNSRDKNQNQVTPLETEVGEVAVKTEPDQNQNLEVKVEAATQG